MKVALVSSFNSWQESESAYFPNRFTFSFKQVKTMTIKAVRFPKQQRRSLVIMVPLLEQDLFTGTSLFFFFFLFVFCFVFYFYLLIQRHNILILIQHSQFSCFSTSNTHLTCLLACFHSPQWYLNSLTVSLAHLIIQPALGSMALFCKIVLVSVRWHELNEVVEQG